MTVTRRDAPPVTPAAREAFDRAAPPREPRRYGPPPEHQAHAVDPSAEDIRARARAHEARHPAPPPREAPDPGRVLVRIPRPDGIELRVSVHTYEGKPYVRVAPWKRGDGETWWPVKGKGASLKVRELARVASALADAMDATDGDASGGAR